MAYGLDFRVFVDLKPELVPLRIFGILDIEVLEGGVQGLDVAWESLARPAGVRGSSNPIFAA